LRHVYAIPEVTIKRPRIITWSVVGAAVAIGVIRRARLYQIYDHERLLMGILAAAFCCTIIQWIMSMFERPYRVTPVQQARLDRLWVTVNVPVYNEDPILLDRTLYALFTQTRLPNRVAVVDDGSAVDYSEVRGYWQFYHPPDVEFSWIWQPNRGKKHAQARTFGADDGDIFVTLDSDTALTGSAIHEGLKPFADRRVQSVAGLELAYNYRKNWLTRLNGTRSLIWQVLSCSAQSVVGDVLVNRGTFALYRAPVIRNNLRAYLEETFFGHPVHLGDDAALTLFARARGRTVQQPTAVQLAMYPETISHHFRQWTRWMRGSTIRTFWRIRYLGVLSYSWWFTVINLWTFMVATATAIGCIVLWPGSRFFLEALVLASIAWAYVMAIRIFGVIRTDESWRTRLGSFLLAPVVYVWSIVALRPLRLYGIMTCLHQGWVTRHAVEVGLLPNEKQAVPMAPPTERIPYGPRMPQREAIRVGARSR
jgi:hyaluronan synthase